ncbi:MAG: outer membrane beta-barrel family protein, partial [Candidatus Symbiothrix sp.]|nr:outer membrane beta-barrel family protein [Candidatus Symbiothrix sp.]
VSLRQNGSQLDSTFTHNNYLSDNIALNFNLEWKPDTMNTLTIRPNFSFNTSSSTEYEEASLYNFDTPTKLRATESNANNQGKGYNAGGSLDYAHKFSKPGRVFSINAQATYNNSTSWEKSNTDYLHQETSNFPDLNQHSENDNHTNSYRTTLAWVEPLGGNRFLQANYRISHSDTKNINSTYDLNYLLDDPLLNALLNDSLSRSTVRNSTNQRLGLSFKAVHRQFNYTLGFNVDPNRSINETWQPSTHLADRSSSHYNNRMANVLGDTLISSTLQDIVNFSPTANFTYNFGQRTNLRINYDGETTQPSATQLRDYIDKSRPTNWVEGNPKLKTGYSQNLQIRFQKYVPETQLMYNLNLSGGFSTNDIINITQYLGDSIRITSYDNINGNWNTRLRGMFNQPLKNKHFSIANNITLSYNNRNSLIVEADTLKNTQKTFSFMDNAQFKYTSTLFDVSLDASVNLNDIANSVNRQQNQQTLSVGIGGSTTWYLPYNWTIESNIQYTKRSGTLASYNIPETMWNASLSKQIFNKQAGTGLLKLYIYDILRDRNDITSSATTNGYLTTQANIIPSYVMCSFIYKFKAFPKSSSAREDDFRPRMRGGEGLRRDSFDSFPR